MQLFTSTPRLLAFGTVPATIGTLLDCGGVTGHFLCFPSDGVKLRSA